MPEQVRIGMDGDPLSRPIDRTQQYLAAIFDELRALHAFLDPSSVPGAAAPAQADTPQPAPASPIGPELAPVVETREAEAKPVPPRSPLPTIDPAIDGDIVATAKRVAVEAARIRRNTPRKPRTKKA